MANYLVTDTQLTSVADAIRAKSDGSAELAFPSGFISEIGNIASESSTIDHTLEDQLITGELGETYTNSRITKIRSYGFSNQTQLRKVELNNCNSIDVGAFNSCTNLEELWLGNSDITDIETSDVFQTLPNQFYRSIQMRKQGSIYVPANLVSAYRSSSAWALYKTHIFSPENYPILWYDTIEDDIDTICEKINNGTANYNLYGTKVIDLGNEGRIQFQIIKTNADELADGSGTAQYTWLAMNILEHEHRFNPPYISQTPNTGAYGGWENSELRYYLNTTIFQLFPQSLQNIIKEVKKYSGGYSIEDERISNVLTTDKLWIPSSHEIQASDTYETLGPIYIGAGTDSNNRIRYKPNTYISHSYLLRSANRYDRIRMINDTGSGGNGSIIEEMTHGILLGFCT